MIYKCFKIFLVMLLFIFITLVVQSETFAVENSRTSLNLTTSPKGLTLEINHDSFAEIAPNSNSSALFVSSNVSNVKRPDKDLKSPESQKIAYDKPVIPAQFPTSRYESLWKNSPFAKRRISDFETPLLAQQYSLGGFAKIGDETYITVVETSTQRRFLVSKTPSKDHSITLISANEVSDKPLESTAIISVGGTNHKITFDKSSLAMAAAGLSYPLTNVASGHSANPTNATQTQFFAQGILQSPQNSPERAYLPAQGTPQNITNSENAHMLQQQIWNSASDANQVEQKRTGNRIFRRRIVDDHSGLAQPMAIPPNTIQQPPQQ